VKEIEFRLFCTYLLTNKNFIKMRIKNFIKMRIKKICLERKFTTFDFLDKKEMANIYGGGLFCWDSKTKTMYYIP